MTGRLGFHRNLFCRMESTSEEREAPARDVQPYFTFGVIADVQFADRADGLSGWLTMRYYRQSRVHLRSAIKEWNGESTLPTFILQLGDIIDGANRKLRTSNESLQVVLKEMEDMKAPFHHIWGNHEFYNFDRDYLTKSKLNTKWMEDERLDGAKPFSAGNTDPLEYYAYHFSPFSNFRIIVVDAYDLSVIGRESSSHKGQESAQFLDSRFQNKSGDSRAPVFSSSPQIIVSRTYRSLTEGLAEISCPGSMASLHFQMNTMKKWSWLVSTVLPRSFNRSHPQSIVMLEDHPNSV
ncbi:hypothetical protein FKM82_026316 [Ascaphus truei]